MVVVSVDFTFNLNLNTKRKKIALGRLSIARKRISLVTRELEIKYTTFAMNSSSSTGINADSDSEIYNDSFFTIIAISGIVSAVIVAISALALLFNYCRERRHYKNRE